MDLNNQKWKELNGAYGTRYNASIELKKLEKTGNKNEADEILDRLWNELYHQGDVGSASYYSVPHLVRIASDKSLFHWRIIGLPLIIEHQRQKHSNPELPNDLKEEYLEAFQKLGDFAVQQLSNELDEASYVAAISAIVTSSGRVSLGRAILEMEDKDVLQEFLKQF